MVFSFIAAQPTMVWERLTAGLSGVINIGDINSSSAYKSVHGQGGGRGSQHKPYSFELSGTIRTSSVLNDLRLLLTSGEHHRKI